MSLFFPLAFLSPTIMLMFACHGTITLQCQKFSTELSGQGFCLNSRDQHPSLRHFPALTLSLLSFQTLNIRIQYLLYF